MAIDRRQLLLGTLSAVALPAVLRGTAHAEPGVTFVSAAKRGDAFTVLLLGHDGSIIRELPLAARGHDIALHGPSGRAVVFARRPGTFAVAFETVSTREPQIFTASEGRHFYGHGAFSSDGRLLYVSENDIANAVGVIGIYDAVSGYQRIGEMPSFGVGPHEIILLGDGKTLAVANGGIDTVPEAGRENLNLDNMEPSLVFIDAGNGVLLAKHTLAAELAQLSIRHIAPDAQGRVWFGGQWEGDASATPELIGCAGCDQGLKLITPSNALGASLKGYIGSVAASVDGAIIAASAPKAGRVLYIDSRSGNVVAESTLKDGCGIAGEAGGTFAVTSGLGAFRHETPGAPVLSETMLADIAFDNHLRRLI